MDPDMNELPTDYTAGVDFRIAKTSKGGYADYSTSNWSRRERPLDEAEYKAIEDNGLYNMSDYLPKKPDPVAVEVIKKMFEASVDGEAYDLEAFGQYFRPAGVRAATGDPVKATTPSPQSQHAPAVAQATAPVVPQAPAAVTEAAGDGNKAEDILAMIRSRQG